MRYWVYLGEEAEAGPFPNYDEADRERKHFVRNIAIGCSPNIFKIRTDEFDQAPPISKTKVAT